VQRMLPRVSVLLILVSDDSLTHLYMGMSGLDAGWDSGRHSRIPCGDSKRQLGIRFEH